MMRAGVGIWFSEDMRAHIQILREHCFFPSSPSAVVLHGIVMRLYFYFHFLLPFFFSLEFLSVIESDGMWVKGV